MSLTSPSHISFTPVEPKDFPLLKGWLANAHVRKWWGEPDHEIELIREGYEQKNSDGPGGYIVKLGERAIAFIQNWKPSDYDAEEPWFKDVPVEAVGIDMFIGPKAETGRGLGTAIMVAFCHKLFAEGHNHLVIDPDGDNHRAIRAYEKAGFSPVKTYQEEQGSVVLMELRRPEKGNHSKNHQDDSI